MRYNLTENQKDTLRWIVGAVRARRLPEQDMAFGYTFDGLWIRGIDDHPQIEEGVLDVLEGNDLLSIRRPDPHSYFITLLGEAYEAVDSDFGTSREVESSAETKYPPVIQDSLTRFSAAKQSQRAAVQQVQVFICYAREDAEQVMEVYRRLEKEGFKPWIDKEDLLPGEEWEMVIRREIKKSERALAFFSKLSVSKRGYFQRELKLLLEVWEEMPQGDIFIIPVKLDECELPERFKRFHCANLFEADGFEKIVRSIRADSEQSETGSSEPSGSYIAEEPKQRKETVEEKAARLKRDRDAEAERQRFLDSEDGVQAAWKEAMGLYQEFERQAFLIRDSGWPMQVKTQRAQGPYLRLDTITSWPYRLIIDWGCEYKNSLSDSSLIITLQKQDKSARYEEKFDNLREQEYSFDVLKSGEQGWRQAQGGSEFYKTEDLVEMTMHDLLDRLDEEKSGSH